MVRRSDQRLNFLIIAFHCTLQFVEDYLAGSYHFLFIFVGSMIGPIQSQHVLLLTFLFSFLVIFVLGPYFFKQTKRKKGRGLSNLAQLN